MRLRQTNNARHMASPQAMAPTKGEACNAGANGDLLGQVSIVEGHFDDASLNLFEQLRA